MTPQCKYVLSYLICCVIGHSYIISDEFVLIWRVDFGKPFHRQCQRCGYIQHPVKEVQCAES